MSTWNIGDKIQNRWEIHKILGGAGKSGMGIVYVVYDHEWKAVLAAKTFQQELLGRIPKAAARFRQEALTWVNLDTHQNVVQARFVETIEGRPFLFLEYVTGGDLSGWIGTPRLTEDLSEVLRLAVQFCDGMEHVLAKGIVAHRDIKPANCLLTEDRTLKVTDFGLSKVFEEVDPDTDTGDVSVRECSTRLSVTGQMAGTPAYMAPEQFADAKHVGVQSDIYAFGVMLYEMVIGQLPFVGRSLQELQSKHTQEAPPGLGSCSGPEATVRLELQALIQACLTKSPLERPAGFATLRQRLARLFFEATGQSAPPPVQGNELNAVQLSNKGISLHELGRSKEALAAHEAALRINPRYAGAWGNKGAVLEALGRKEEAFAAWEAALRINPREEKVWDNKGQSLRNSGRSAEALAAFEAALQINPRSENSWLGKGNSLSDLGRKQEALAAFEFALRINPRYALAWSNKAVVLSALGRKDEALAACETAVRLNPRLGGAWFNRGVQLLDGFARHAEALVAFEEAQKLGHVQAAQAIVRCRKHLAQQLGGHPRADNQPRKPRIQGVPLPTVGRTPAPAPNELLRQDMAASKIQHLNQVLMENQAKLRINPQNEIAWLNSGIVLFDLGRREEALAAYEEALRLNPRLAQAWIHKGFALSNYGRKAEALVAYEAGLRLNPQDEKALYNKGNVLSALGRKGEALAIYPNH